MNLKYRLTFLFCFFVFAFLLVSFTVVYFLCEDFRKDDFARRLRANARNEYRSFAAAPKKSPLGIHSNLMPLVRQSIVIYDSLLNVIHFNSSGQSPKIDPAIFERTKRNEEVIFKQDGREGIVIYVKQGASQVFVVAMAYDQYGVRKMVNLRNNLIITLAIGLVLSGVFAFFFAKHALQPLNDLDKQIQGVTENNFTISLSEQGHDEEIKRIASSFNNMLLRLQKSFEMQKSFVQHASHELRTPLANMLSQTEASLNKELSSEELKSVLYSLREDQVGLTELINSLLLLSQIELLDFRNDVVPIRVDEILYETIEVVKERYPDAAINLDFVTVPENSDELTLKGNELLLKTAFQNLIKNAYLFSNDKTVSIKIDVSEKGIEIIFENNGTQLSNVDKENLFVPFYRGENSVKIKGTGIGLSLVERIVKLHNGSIAYEALRDNRNQFTVSLNK